MRIVFVSNFMSIHQQPLCQALFNKSGTDFLFIETSCMDSDRVEMGFDDEKPSYVRSAIENDDAKEKCLKLICESDVAILGSAPDVFLQTRLRTGKLTFKYSERFFKGKNTFLERIRFRISSFKHISPLKKKNVYFLCASAYTSQDINRYEDFRGRSFKWGYFREVLPVSPEKLISQKRKNTILWVGRMIDWKHPELAVELAMRLKQEGIPFELQMVGSGDMTEHVVQMVEDNNLQETVHLLGAKSPDDVRVLMDQSEIFIGTSDFKEGWGVVINEAMNSCCAVVASHAMGSAPFLIDNGVNGVIFESENLESLFIKVKSLLTDREKLSDIQSNAYNILKTTWNAETAAERLLTLINDLSNHHMITQYEDGPCSVAEILENDWYQE